MIAEVGVQEAHRPVSFSRQDAVARPIVSFAMFMTCAVHFNDQPPVVADKVEEIASERCLPSKVKAL